MKNTKPHLITLTQYILLLHKTKDGKGCTHQTLHARRQRGAIEFIIGGNTPEYKIDINKYPPSKFKKEARGRKKSQT